MAGDPAHAAFKRGKHRKVLVPRAARHLGHPHDLAHGKDIHRHPLPDKGVTRKPKPSHITKGHEAMVDRNLEILAEAVPEVASTEVEIFKDKMALVLREEQEGAIAPLTPSKREAYVALETHKEMAALILAAGGTLQEAADWAGVSTQTVSRYLEDAHLRARIDEHRAIVKAKIGGRIEAWMDRRTADPDALDEADPKVTLAIYDRISAPTRGTSSGQTNNILITPHEAVMERLAGIAGQPATARAVDDAGAESGGFPVVGTDGPAVAGGGS